MNKPILRIEWHHPNKFYLGREPIIWLIVYNDGGDAVLTSDGLMGHSQLGKGEYNLPGGGWIELGYLWGSNPPPITEDFLSDGGNVHYKVYFRAENDAGADVYIGIHYIEVEGK